MNRFRPQEINKRHTLRLRLKGYGNEWINYNWQPRTRWHPAGWKPNQISISRRFVQLHYLACHAPAPVQKRWEQAYKTFCNKHLPYHRSSMRFLNQYTAHRWL
jgi:hypothetical protein